MTKAKTPPRVKQHHDEPDFTLHVGDPAEVYPIRLNAMNGLLSGRLEAETARALGRGITWRALLTLLSDDEARDRSDLQHVAAFMAVSIWQRGKPASFEDLALSLTYATPFTFDFGNQDEAPADVDPDEDADPNA